MVRHLAKSGSDGPMCSRLKGQAAAATSLTMQGAAVADALRGSSKRPFMTS